MPYDRPTWDLTSLLYAVESPESYFDVSKNLTISVNDDAHTSFSEDENGNHVYLKANQAQAEKIKQRFTELVSRKPQNK
jgi:hypothetical protein